MIDKNICFDKSMKQLLEKQQWKFHLRNDIGRNFINFIHILRRYAYIPSFLKAQSCNLLSHLFIETSYHIFFALRNNKFYNSPRYVHVMCQHYDRSKQKKWKLFRWICMLLTLVITRSCHLWFSWLYISSY